MQKMFQETHPVGTTVVVKIDSRGGEVEGAVLHSTTLSMSVRVTSDGPLKDREIPVSPETFIRVKEA